MKAISDNLIHFLGQNKPPNEQLKIFKKIINKGLRLNSIDIKFGDKKYITNKGVCFTDIPLSLCRDHTKEYGEFGIGFKKSSIKRDGGHPARYFIDNLPDADYNGDFRWAMNENLKNQYEMIKKLECFEKTGLYDENKKLVIKPGLISDWLIKQKAVLSYEKETGELGPARDREEGDKYYKEREWRLVPLNGARFVSKKIRKPNQYHFYMFTRDDINMVVTPDENTRKQVINFLNNLDIKDNRLKEFVINPLPIISYEDLQKW